MSNTITLFHGSDHIIRKPLYGAGKNYNDYGKGFYCTKAKNLAKEWSVTEDKDGFVNQYEIDVSNLSILNLNRTDYPMLRWLTVLLENRTFDSYSQLRTQAKDYLKEHFSLDYKSYDIIIGYRADDSYFQFAKDFLDGVIPYSTLSRAMFLGKLGNQFVLKSEKAFDKLSYVASEKVLSSEWFPQKKSRETEARENYRKSRGIRLKSDEIFMFDIIRGRLTENDRKILRQGLFAGSPEKSRGYD